MGQRKRFADGKVTMPYKHFLGYERVEDGNPQIVEKEAIIVRLIYQVFLTENHRQRLLNISLQKMQKALAAKSDRKYSH